MVQTFLLLDTITNEKTVKFMQRDIIASTITWHLGLVGSNNFGEYTSFSPFNLSIPSIPHPHPHTMARSSKTIHTIFMKLSEISKQYRGKEFTLFKKKFMLFGD